MANPAPVPALGQAQTVLEGSCPHAVLMHQGLMYVADSTGISVWRLEGEKLVVVARVQTPGNAQDIALLGDGVAVADGRYGVAFFSLDDAVRPRLVRQTALPGECSRVVASGQTVAALCSGGVVALLDPGQPPALLSVPGEPKAATWIGEHLYVASSGEGLVHIALQGSSWTVIDHDTTLRMIVSVTALGSRLFVGLRDKRLLEVDVSAFPARRLGEVTLLHRPARLHVHEQTLLAASVLPGDVDATLLDVSERGHPRISSKLPYGIQSGAAVHASSWVFARGAAGLSLYSTTNVATMDMVPGAGWNRLSAADGRVIGWREDTEEVVSWMLEGHETKPIAFNHGTLREVVGCDRAWCTLDTTGHVCRRPFDDDKATCTAVAQGGTSIAWTSARQTLWLADGDGVLRGFAGEHDLQPKDVIARPPRLPHERLSRLVIDGDRAVAIDPNFGILQVFDLGPSPKLRGFYLLQAKPSDVAFVHDVAFVAEPTAGLQVIDVHDPDKPHEVHWERLSPGPSGVSLRPSGISISVALAQGEAGVSMWRWTNEGGLVPQKRSDTAGLATAVEFVGDELWVADGTHILRFAVPEARP